MSSLRKNNSSASSGQPWIPLVYMKKAVKWLVSERNAAALFLDPSMGKTAISYAAVKVLKAKRLAKGALVVAPRRPAVSVWPAEQAKWTDFAELSVGLLHGPNKDAVLSEKHDVYVMTYDGLRWLFGAPAPNFRAMAAELKKLQRRADQAEGKEKKDLAKQAADAEKELASTREKYATERKLVEARLKLLFKNVDILIFDELSKMKHMKTGRHRILADVLPRFARRWGLTGSPAANGLMNLFGQVYALDLGKAFSPYITHFRRNFFDEIKKHANDPYPVYAPKPGAEKQIFSRLKDLALRLDADDYLTLPKVVLAPMRFELPDEHRAQYDEMEQDMMLHLRTGEVFTAKQAATVSMKCRQITSGAIYHDRIDPLTGMPAAGARKWTELHDEKVQMCVDLIEELQGQQLLIAYEFHHELERLLKVLGKDAPYIGRGVSDKKALAYEDAWNAGELPYLLAHPASIGHGLNLQGSSAHHILWFSGTWDYELWDQFIRRLKRQNSDAKRIFVYMLIARDTVDESVYNDKNRKERGQRTLLSAFKR